MLDSWQYFTENRRKSKQHRLDQDIHAVVKRYTTGRSSNVRLQPRLEVDLSLVDEHLWSPMSPETTIEKIRKAPAATSVHHIVRASSRTQHRGTHTRTPSSLATRPISLQVPANRPDQRSASPQLKQPSSTSTVRRGGLSTASLSTSTTKSDARYDRKDHLGPGVASPASAMPYPVATSRKPLLGWNAPGPRSALPTGGLGSRAKRKQRFIS